MTMRYLETTGIVSALYKEYDRIYFNCEMPKEPKILLHRMPRSEFRLRKKWDAQGKFTGNYEYILNGKYILDSNDTPEETEMKIQKLSEGLRSLMVLMYHKEVLGYRPIMSKRYKDAVDKMNACVGLA